MTITTYNGEPPEADEPTHDDHYNNGQTYNVTTLPIRPPSNTQAEQAILGAALIQPAALERLQGEVDPQDFYEPKHETIWNTIQTIRAEGRTPDAITLNQQLQDNGQLRQAGGGPYLIDLMQACPNPDNAIEYATIVRNAARIRNVAQTITKLHTLVDTARPDTVDNTLAEALQTLDDVAARVGPRHATTIRTPTIADLLHNDDEEEYDWIIPGLIEHQERIIITAEEGAGKSTLLRQIGITAAAGIHPFNGQTITPIRVLHIDVENSLRQTKRQYRPLAAIAGNRLDPNNLRIEIKISGIDLTKQDDRDWLLNTVDTASPDLLMIGPIYKLANGNPNDEEAAKPVALALDKVREQNNCGIIIEGHSAKAPANQRRRPHEPYGWSGWMRWPEVGIFLNKDGTIHHWRGAREEREWPHKLTRNGTWPWSPEATEADQDWIIIQNARLKNKAPMSIRTLENNTNLSRSTIHRLIGTGGQYAYGWSGFNNSKQQGDDPR